MFPKVVSMVKVPFSRMVIATKVAKNIWHLTFELKFDMETVGEEGGRPDYLSRSGISQPIRFLSELYKMSISVFLKIPESF